MDSSTRSARFCGRDCSPYLVGRLGVGGGFDHRRAGRGYPREAILPNNLTLTVTGAGLLRVWLFGFNPGQCSLGAMGLPFPRSWR